jgi:hypothetical protein
MMEKQLLSFGFAGLSTDGETMVSISEIFEVRNIAQSTLNDQFWNMT